MVKRIERLEYLDLSKGLGIILIILGHIYEINNPITMFAYSFHIPLFFIISGMLLKYTDIESRNFKYILIKKFKSLIIPYISFELLVIFLLMIKHGFTLQEFKTYINNSIFMYSNAGTTWFLVTLFFAEVIFLLLKKYTKSDIITIILSSILTIIALTIKADNHNILVVFRCFVAIGFLAFGYYTFELVYNKDMNFINILILFIFNYAMIYFNGFVDLFSLQYNNIVIYIVCSITGSMATIFLFKKVYYLKLLSYLGTNTLIIMATHQVIINYLNKIINIPLSYLKGMIILCILTLIEIPIIEVINRYFPFILGKFKRE